VVISFVISILTCGNHIESSAKSLEKKLTRFPLTCLKIPFGSCSKRSTFHIPFLSNHSCDNKRRHK
jgi:hypothetical protein